jgi:hypothetical protein
MILKTVWTMMKKTMIMIKVMKMMTMRTEMMRVLMIENENKILKILRVNELKRKKS